MRGDRMLIVVEYYRDGYADGGGHSSMSNFSKRGVGRSTRHPGRDAKNA
jgi:hypothetical protein